jgi:5-methylcytosine-specific restriction endonuclease McrA
MAKESIYRIQARAQGLKRYNTNEPCRHGHLCERYTVDSKCVRCVAILAAGKSKRWQQANPEKVKAKTQRWRDANPEKFRESNRRSKKGNQQKYTDRQRADYAINPEKYRTVERKRRAQMYGSDGTHTAADLVEIIELQGHRCAYCRTDLTQTTKHVDHIVPLALGGSNGRQNLQFCCPPCNQSKGARDPIEFAQSLGLLL